MTDHQRRVLSRLRDSLEASLRKQRPLEEMQADLDANLGVVEVAALRDSIAAASNRLDECIHIYEEQEARRVGERIVTDLIQEMDSHFGAGERT